MTTSIRGTAVPGARAADGRDPDEARGAVLAVPCARAAGWRLVASCAGPVAIGAGTPRVPAAGAGRGRRTAAMAARLRRLSHALIAVPFTLGYTLVLLGTGLYTHLGDPGTVRDLLVGSSTDVAHLSQRPLLTLLVSALWAVGGITSPYLLAFPLVLGALERRVGAVRTAGVFLLGHVLATLLTELPVAASVAVGHLPASSLRRLDYGVSYGLIACAAALAGLLPPRRRWALLGGIGLALAAGSLVDIDPLTGWGHAFALLDGAGRRFAHSERASGNT
ncbi:rhomboid-like protein [Streptomyces malaysiensis]